MALKFLNKKGWHTGSLRNIENVWKAEQKHDAEQKKLEELKKQIKEEREAQEFRILQEQAGLAPKQERLEFLYDSGLAVGKTTTDEYLLGKPLEESKETELEKAADGPGALFVSKPQSANDAWRKLHSDPLLLIRQQEQAALTAIKSNPVKMEMIRKEVRDMSKQNDLRDKERKHKRKELKKKKGKLRHESDGDEGGSEEEDIGHSKHKARDTRRKFKDSDSDSGGEEGITHSKHKSKERERNLKDSRGESSSSEGDIKHSKKKRREVKQTNLGSVKKIDGTFEQKHEDRWRRVSERRTGASPEPSDNKSRHFGSGRSDGNVERRHEDRGLKGRDEERSHERQWDDSRWRNGSSRRSYRSPDRKHYDARLHGGNGRSPDGNDHDRRWRDDSGRRNGRSPEGKRFAERHVTSENGRSPDRTRDDTRRRDVARRPEKSPERRHYEGRNQSGYARNEEGKSSSDAKHVLASSLREKNSEVLQEEQGAGQTNKCLSEAPVQKQHKSKLSEAEKAARLKEMQVDAELHEEQRWQRLKKGAEADARDSEQAKQTCYGQGKSFIDDTNKSVFGAQNTTNASLSESVRRRAHYRDRGAADGQSNAFRR